MKDRMRVFTAFFIAARRGRIGVRQHRVVRATLPSAVVLAPILGALERAATDDVLDVPGAIVDRFVVGSARDGGPRSTVGPRVATITGEMIDHPIQSRSRCC